MEPWIKLVLLIAVLWHIIGVISYIFTVSYKNGKLRLSDLIDSTLTGIWGPLLALGLLLDVVRNLRSKHGNKVLWRSKTQKAKEVLFGKLAEKNDDDDSGSNPWGGFPPL